MKNDQILYWDQGKSSFVIKDIGILSTEFTVIDFTFKAKNNLLILFELFKQLPISVYYAISCKAVVCQFSGYHSLVPFIVFRVFGRKRIIIAGGTDCVAFPSIKYGNFQKKYLKWFTIKSFQLANFIIPVDKTLIKYTYNYQDNDFKEQGYRAHIHELKAEDKTIYNGYDSEKFYVHKTDRKTNSFLTVAANLTTDFGQKLKGIDLIIELARSFREAYFTIVGGEGLIIEDKPANLILLGTLMNDKLIDVYNDNQFYLQLSMSEGFPNALCEAMLCGCIPIVSNVGAMKMIVGANGHVLEKKDINLLKHILQRAMSSGTNEILQLQLHNSIKNRFKLETRKVELTEFIKKIIR